MSTERRVESDFRVKFIRGVGEERRGNEEEMMEDGEQNDDDGEKMERV